MSQRQPFDFFADIAGKEKGDSAPAVDRAYGIALLDQFADDVSAEETGTAGNQDRSPRYCESC